MKVIRKGRFGLCSVALLATLLSVDAAGQSFSWGVIVGTYPRGSDGRSMGITENMTEAPAYGPAAIATTREGAPLVLDSVNRRVVKVSEDGQLTTVALLNEFGIASDIVRIGSRVLIWDGKTRYIGSLTKDEGVIRKESQIEATEADSEFAVSSFLSHGAVKSEVIQIRPGSLESTGRLNSRIGIDRGLVSPLLSADRSRFEYSIDIFSRTNAQIILARGSRKAESLVLDVKTQGELGSIVPVAIDFSDRSYFRVEELLGSKVKVWLYRFSSDGEADGGFYVPDEKLEIVPNRYLTVSDQGAVFFLQSELNQTTVVRLRHFDQPEFEKQIGERALSTDALGTEPRVQRPSRETAPATVAPISRKAILETAERFRTLSWTLGNGNYGSERTSECAPEQGRKWLRPASLDGRIGELVQSVPYNWGGYMSTDQFTELIRANAVAGNVCTCRSTYNCVDQSAAGVDCSGFVSQAWRVSRKTTATLFDVADRVVSFDDLMPGDALNKPNSHVRLFVGPSETGNGTIRAYESSVSCGGVCIRDFSRKQLEGYLGARRRSVTP